MSRVTFIGLIFVFIFLSFIAFNKAMPESKNKEVMNLISPYMPYKLEKRLAGLTIVNTKTGVKEKPSNELVYKRLDELEKNWGKKYLKIKDSILLILNDNNKTIKSFKLKNKKQKTFIHKFFGI
ncbi:MAG: hypothetical protein L3J44_09945 [Campylobacteraceae bacterium]|nr:hypothetical protein [Campylobacteraceae bacterium]